MVRLVAYLIPVMLAAAGLSWLADRPGSLVINWGGHEVETSVFHAVVMLALLIGLSILVWSIAVQLWRSPALLGSVFNRRRQAKGLEALTSGMIAIGAGDRQRALEHAVTAGRALPHAPLTLLLRAQAAELSGRPQDRAAARRIYEGMLADPETEQLGLRGLFLEAGREGEQEAARQYADRALKLNPKLGWPVDAVFEIQCKQHDWAGALETLHISQRNKQIDKPTAERRRAVLLTAQAQAIEDSSPDEAMKLALEAHHLAHDLSPAAAIAGRVLAARGHTKRAAHVIERAWKKSPHPDLATVYAHARLGDSPRDRLDRVKRLTRLNQSIETPIAIASAAIEARDWTTARQQLAHLGDDRMTQRVCMMMARVEAEETADAGRAREWMARAVHAPRDPAWTTDGAVAERWAAVSPVTGALDAFEWRVPVSDVGRAENTVLAGKLDELMKLMAPQPTAGASASISPSASTVTAQTIPQAKAKPDVRPKQVAEVHSTVKAGPQADLPAAVIKAEAKSNDTSAARTAALAPSGKAETFIIPRDEVRPEVRPTKPADAKPLANASVANGAANGHAVADKVKPAPPSAPAREAQMLSPPRAPDDPGLEVPDAQAKAGKRPEMGLGYAEDGAMTAAEIAARAAGRTKRSY